MNHVTHPNFALAIKNTDIDIEHGYNFDNVSKNG